VDFSFLHVAGNETLTVRYVGKNLFANSQSTPYAKPSETLHKILAQKPSSQQDLSHANANDVNDVINSIERAKPSQKIYAP
jgi:hypothetical protein